MVKITSYYGCNTVSVKSVGCIMVESPPCGWSPTNDGWNPTTGGWSPTTGERTPLRDYNRRAGRRNEEIGEL